MTDSSPVTSADLPFGSGALAGVGSLPHRDVKAAAAFAIGEFDIPTIPTLPKRSAAETMVAQAIEGLPGVSLGQYGSFAIDPGRLGDDVAITTGLDGDAFVGLRAFLDLARLVAIDGRPVKWQFVGPVTLGVALQRAGVAQTAAFHIAARAVRHHLVAIEREVRSALPSSPQLVVLDEPWLTELMSPEFPIPPDEAVDLISTAMAAVAGNAMVGIHCCGPVDLATMLAAGPSLVSIPVGGAVLDYAGYLDRFLREGGTIAWGAVPTDGPVPSSAERAWRGLSDVWCGLVERGADPVALRRQSLVTPACGLASHSVSVARRITRLSADVAKRVKDQAGATRFALGA